MLYLTYIDFVPYVHFKTKQNLYRYLNEHAINAWLIVLHTYVLYRALFFEINKYQLLYCILQYTYAETWFTLVKNRRFFKEKKKRVNLNEIYS